MLGDYSGFLDSKAQLGARDGFVPTFMPGALLDFQGALTDWSIRQGRAAMFADCGLGKTLMQLVWAENVHRHTNKPVLVVAPLAVAEQTVREGEKFGIECHRSKDGTDVRGVTVTNYERLHYFNPQDFAGIVCDESSILKSFDGSTKAAVTEFMRVIRYRLLCTATAAPNDYIELGTHSEALGYMGYTDMLSHFFTNRRSSVDMGHGRFSAGDKWTFKPHAEQQFWRWVASWARACRKPSDLGFEDGAFVLPPLEQRETVIQANAPRAGMLFDVTAVGLAEEREVRRRTIPERCEAAAEKVTRHDQPAVMWCHLNDEADTLVRMVPGAEQVSGADSDDAKEEKFEAFRTGHLRVLVIKPRIGAFGLNWQHCAHVVYFPSDSYEQFYQAVRRCWRFGQTRTVNVDLILTEAQDRMMANLQRKADAADKMFTDLVAHMNNAITLDRNGSYERALEVPSWL